MCSSAESAGRPAWSPSLWIQREIGASLKRRILVLPVLLGDAANIEAASLPKPIRQLAALRTEEPGVVALVSVAREAYPEAKDPTWSAVDLQLVRKLPRTVSIDARAIARCG